MSDIRSTDPQLLLEAARVFNVAGRDYRSAAEVVAQLALESKVTTEPRVRQAIIGDAAALYLSGRLPGGYQAALELLERIGEADAEDPEGRLHLLRALANGQKYRDAPEEARDQLRGKIISDLKIAVSRNPGLRRTIPHFWQPTPEGAEPEDDLRAAYLEDIRQFEEIINPPLAGQTGATRAGTGATGATGRETGATGG